MGSCLPGHSRGAQELDNADSQTVLKLTESADGAKMQAENSRM